MKEGVSMSLISTTEEYLTSVIKGLGYDIESVKLEKSKIPEFGQYQINIAMTLTKQKGENPRAIAEKIVLGRINKFYQEICLVDQEFVKDPSKKVSDILKDSKVLEFARFETGEGIEKKEENFAEEVMKQLK